MDNRASSPLTFVDSDTFENSEGSVLGKRKRDDIPTAIENQDRIIHNKGVDTHNLIGNTCDCTNPASRTGKDVSPGLLGDDSQIQRNISEGNRSNDTKETSSDDLSTHVTNPKSSSIAPSSSSSHDDDVDSCPYNWTEYFDSNSGKSYYYNLISKRTQWEKPTGFVSYSLPQSEITTTTFDLSSSATFKATFNKKTGAFSTASESSYWETVGRPTDREGRQMSAFFDLNQLDENRQQALEKKEKLAKAKIDWRAYKEEKKAVKSSRSKEWLLKDD